MIKNNIVYCPYEELDDACIFFKERISEKQIDYRTTMARFSKPCSIFSSFWKTDLIIMMK